MSVLAGTQVQDTLLVTGGVPLSGEVQAGGSKNAALPLLAAAALPAGGTGLDNVPACADVQAMSGLLTEAGWPVQAGDSPGHVRVGAVAPGLTQPVLSGASRIRASYYLVPALLAAYGQASLPWPGGCSVGERGMDLHFTVYEAFGDTAQTSPAGYVIRAGAGARGTVRVALPFRSRGATVAALLRGVSAGRPVVIGNPNLSAELYAVYRALEAAGCAVEVTGQAVTMEPGDPASPVRWRVPGDKIEAGTLACAIAATGGSGQVRGVQPDDLAPLAAALNVLGIPVAATAAGGGTLEIPSDWEPSGRPLNGTASLEPGGLDADWEPGLLALAIGLPGLHRFADAINPGRHANLVPQLRALGAVITETSTTACLVRGPQALSAARVRAADIRTGSALLIAALTATGTTVISELSQLRRGHADLPGTLRLLGAAITSGKAPS